MDWTKILMSAGLGEKKAAIIGSNMDRAIEIEKDRIARHSKKKLKKESKVDVTEIINTYKKK